MIEGYVYLLLSIILLTTGWLVFNYNFWLGQIFIIVSSACFVNYMIKFRIKNEDKDDKVSMQ